jgi:hypothetical protein|tara:strand:+ start:5201 stop:5473 length:273 start_codon:yes stop_codon:yes gene_type:complete
VDDRTEPIARQLLDRYGVIFPELLARDALTYRWRNRLVVRDGLPIASMENGSVVELANVSPEIMDQAKVVLSVPISHSGYRLDQPDLVIV